MGRTMGRGTAIARRMFERRESRRVAREASRTAREASRAAHSLATDAERLRREAEAMRRRLTPLVAEARGALSEGEAHVAPLVEEARQAVREGAERLTPLVDEARHVARGRGERLAPRLEGARLAARERAFRRAAELSEQLREAVVEAEALAKRAASVADRAAIAAAASDAEGRLRQSGSSWIARAVGARRGAREPASARDEGDHRGDAGRAAGDQQAAADSPKGGDVASAGKAMTMARAAKAAAAMRRAGRPGPLAVGFGLGAAQAAFAAAFRGPRDRFWQRMTITGLALGTYAVVARPALRHTRVGPLHAVLGAASAATLYETFRVGDTFARRYVPSGASDIAEIYALRGLRPRGEIALRLVAVIGPAEELFWRGFVQEGLALRYGRWRGAALATAAYGGVHAITGNFTLMGAAAVAGAHWSALYAAGIPLGALIVSHQIWDVWIFLVQPPGEAGATARATVG